MYYTSLINIQQLIKKEFSYKEKILILRTLYLFIWVNGKH